MKGLRKYLTPFAPDQSGAAAVLYDLGGMTVICDAGGCAGNIFGFDEPRGAYRRSAFFSAGLRDLDAIMGQDEKLVRRIAAAAEQIDVRFIALIGTPVPAVIGTDYAALARMLRKKTGLPVLTVDTDGTALYDRGEEKAYLALYDVFAKEPFAVVPGKVNVIGEALGSDPYGSSEDPLGEIMRASEAERNIAASPSGIAAAQLLQERFGTPYELRVPDAGRMLPETDYRGKRVLVVHQHVLTDSLRRELAVRGASFVTAATWFSFASQIRQAEDIALKEEDDFTALVSDGAYDIILADRVLAPLAPDFQGQWIDLPHFALSGRRS